MLPWVHFKILTPFESAKAFFQSWDFQNRRGSAILFLMHFICRQERITFLKARKLEKIITSLNRPQSHLLKIIGRVIYDSELSRDGRRITHFGAILFVSTSSMMSWHKVRTTTTMTTSVCHLRKPLTHILDLLWKIIIITVKPNERQFCHYHISKLIWGRWRKVLHYKCTHTPNSISSRFLTKKS